MNGTIRHVFWGPNSEIQEVLRCLGFDIWDVWFKVGSMAFTARIYRVSYMPGGAGFLPSTVCWIFWKLTRVENICSHYPETYKLPGPQNHTVCPKTPNLRRYLDVFPAQGMYHYCFAGHPARKNKQSTKQHIDGILTPGGVFVSQNIFCWHLDAKGQRFFSLKKASFFLEKCIA